MAKQTGQITVLKNNKVTNVEHQIRFIFTKNNGERITRDTTNKGVINFDIPNGDWNVSWFAVDGDQKVLPLRAGLQLKITSSTPPTALADWIYGDNTHVADPILTQWTTVLDEMKSVRDEFRRENSFIGTGKIMKVGAFGLGNTIIIPQNSDLNDYITNGFYAVSYARDADTIANLPEKIKTKCSIVVYCSDANKENNDATQIVTHYNSTLTAIRTHYAHQDRWTDWHYIYNTENTTVDSNGFLKAASPIIKLFNDRIEHNGQFDEEPVFEKIGVGTYKISNTLGLAREGWTYEKPRGKDGNPYFRIIVKKTEDGCIISVHDEFEALEEATITDIEGNERKINKVVKILGEARDIKPHERWIDLRFHEEPEEIVADLTY